MNTEAQNRDDAARDWLEKNGLDTSKAVYLANFLWHRERALRKALEDTCAWIERVACEVDEEHGVVIPGCIAQCQVIGMALDATKGDGEGS